MCLVLIFVTDISCLSKVHAKQKSIGIFQFIAESMDVVGIENDVTYVVRNELRKSDNLSLLNQREMEVTLMRNEIIQNFEVDDAVRAGQILNVDFIIIGTVSKSDVGIISHISLISVRAKQAIQNWSFAFSNRQDVRNRAEMIGSALSEGIDADIELGSSDSDFAAQWLADFSAQVTDGFINIEWQLIDKSAEILGFNLYKSSNPEGPFSYVTSVLELSYKEAINDTSGDFFYQLSLINAEGEEIRSENIAKVAVQAATKSTLAAPAIVKKTAFLRGFEILFVPSAINSQANITEYHLLRRVNNSPWNVIKKVELESTDKNNKPSANIQNYTLSDNTAKVNVDYDYAIRAVNNVGELGTISDVYSYQSNSSPQLFETQSIVARRILLKWEPVSVGSGYILYRRAQGEVDWHKLATISNISVSNYQDKDIDQDGQAFDYSIAVFDTSSETEKSQHVSLISKPSLMAPKAFATQSGLPRLVKLSWLPSTDKDLKGFAIYRAPFTKESKVNLVKIAEVLNPAANSYTDKTANTDGADFYYAVASINIFDNYGELSPVKRGTTKQPPNSPDYLTTQVADSSITLSWAQGDVSALKGFAIQRRWHKQHWHDVATVDKSVFSFIDTKLLPQAKVEYRIQAIDIDDIPSQSVISDQQQTLNKLLFVKQNDGLLREVNLQWPSLDMVGTIEVFRKHNHQSWRLIDTIDGQASHYKDTVSLLDDTEYEYLLKIYIGEELITSSDIISMKTKDIAAPNSIFASVNKPREIVINWQANSDESIKSVLVYRASSLDDYARFVLISEIARGNIAKYIDTTDSGSIEHGMTYKYKVASKNIFDVVGPQSASFSGNSKKLPDSAHNLVATTDETHIALKWSVGNEQDLDRVRIYRKWQHQDKWLEVADMPSQITNYEDKALLPYSDAAYKVLLTDQDGLESKESQIVTQSSQAEVKISTPKQNQLREATLHWSSNEFVNQYEVIRSTDKVNWKMVGKTTFNSFKDTKNLVDQTQYFYRVLPFHASHRLGESEIVTVSTKDLPLPPRKIVATNGLVREVMLTWETSDDTDVGGYIISRIEADGSLDRLDKLKRTENRYSDKGGIFSTLSHGIEYQYVLSSFNIHDVQGEHSEIISAKTKAIPRQVTDLSVSSIDGNVLLEWRKNSESDIQSYQVYRGRSCSRTQKENTLAAEVTRYTDTDVELGKQYCYQVLAVDNDSLIGTKSVGKLISLPEAETSL